MSENPDLYNAKPEQIVMYSASWCPDCQRSRAVLQASGIPYLEVDIGKDPRAFPFLEKFLRRVRVPVLFFPNGTLLIEPSDEILRNNLSYNQ